MCPAGWGLYNELCGVGSDKTTDILSGDPRYTNYVVIDDWTDDFDCLKNYKQWMMYRGMLKE